MVNDPFKLTTTDKQIHAQAWVTSCTGGVIECKVGVAIWERGSAPPFIVAENPGVWWTPCKIGKRVPVNYTCITHHNASFYTEGFLSVRTTVGNASGATYSDEITLACT
jgi:hypothetical protein